jgi:hypothetical protein
MFRPDTRTRPEGQAVSTELRKLFAWLFIIIGGFFLLFCCSFGFIWFRASEPAAQEVPSPRATAFDGNDPTITAEWLSAELENLGKIHSTKNAFLYEEASRAFSAKLDQVHGKPIQWEFAVDFVGRAGVALAEKRFPPIWRHEQEDYLRRQKGSQSIPTLVVLRPRLGHGPDPTEATDDSQPNVPLTDWIRSLRTGDRVRVSGKINRLRRNTDIPLPTTFDAIIEDVSLSKK